MLPSFLFAALVALTPTQSPAPSPSAAPVLQEIAHVRASACQTLVAHANVTIDAAMQNDMDLTRTVRALKTSHLNGTAIERRNSLQELETLAKDIDQRATAGNKEIKDLRRIADATSDPKKKQEILAFANAIGGAIYRQYKIAFDLNGFIGNLETRDMAKPDDTFGNMNTATTGSPNAIPGASGVTVNGQPVDSGGFGSSQPAVGPLGVQRLLPTDDDAMASSLADDFISQIHDVTTDEATASTHADGATSGC